MSTPDSFRSRLDGMVDTRHPLVVLTGRLLSKITRRDGVGRRVDQATRWG